MFGWGGREGDRMAAHTLVSVWLRLALGGVTGGGRGGGGGAWPLLCRSAQLAKGPGLSNSREEQTRWREPVFLHAA